VGGGAHCGRGRLGLGCDGAGCWARLLEFVLERGAYEGGEERVRLEGLGFEFGVELAAEEPRVVRGFDDFDVVVSREYGP